MDVQKHWQAPHRRILESCRQQAAVTSAEPERPPIFWRGSDRCIARTIDRTLTPRPWRSSPVARIHLLYEPL